MNRRTTLATLFGQKNKQETVAAVATVDTISFEPYDGPWEWEHAAHLLRRTTFGPTKVNIQQALSDGLAATIEMLFSEVLLPAPPVYYDFELDPNVPIGETWVDELDDPLLQGQGSARKRSFLAWCNMQMQAGEMNIKEKMILFWHNHFVVAGNNNGRRLYRYDKIFRENALGNFRTLTEKITIDPSMLVYLNGNQNSVNGPNENYARELLELFTIGKGETAGPGDYTNYTETDIVEIAKALTGWRSVDIFNDNDITTSSFQQNRHDTSDKQLSARFDNVIITDEGEEEYKTVIDIILQKEETARYICRKLYGWFVHPIITDEVETNVIEPMAQMLYADNYEVENALKALLSSQCFYDASIRGCMLSHPLDHWHKLLNTFEVALPEEDLIKRYRIFIAFHARLGTTDMVIHSHPTVAGWKAFYQSPQFDKLWISAVSLPLRQQEGTAFVNGFTIAGFNVRINALEFVAALDFPSNPNLLITEIASILFVFPLTEEQITALKEVLIPGLPDFEWTVEYGAYIAGDDSLEESVINKLENLIKTMVNMPEFYLI